MRRWRASGSRPREEDEPRLRVGDPGETELHRADPPHHVAPPRRGRQKLGEHQPCLGGNFCPRPKTGWEETAKGTNPS